MTLPGVSRKCALLGSNNFQYRPLRNRSNRGMEKIFFLEIIGRWLFSKIHAETPMIMNHICIVEWVSWMVYRPRFQQKWEECLNTGADFVYLRNFPMRNYKNMYQRKVNGATATTWVQSLLDMTTSQPDCSFISVSDGPWQGRHSAKTAQRGRRHSQWRSSFPTNYTSLYLITVRHLQKDDS